MDSRRLLAAGILLTATSVFAAEINPPRDSDGRLYFLIARGKLLSANPDGSDLKVLVDSGMSGPDGVAVDSRHGHIYWTNMGKVRDDDGSVQRSDMDGSHVVTIVPVAGTFTAKQLKLDSKHGKLYWSDREGMRVMRSNMDGSAVEILFEAAHGDEVRGDQRNWCVGIAVDTDRGKIYWTQKGGPNANRGVIRRANLEIPQGQTAANRGDVETLFEGLPEPIDMDLDLATRTMYWTDRGDPPRGNTVNRAPMDAKPGTEPRILVSGLKEGIGLTLDLKHGRMFFTDLGGSVYSANLDGSGSKPILTGQGGLTGIAYVP